MLVHCNDKRYVELQVYTTKVKLYNLIWKVWCKGEISGRRTEIQIV